MLVLRMQIVAVVAVMIANGVRERVHHWGWGYRGDGGEDVGGY
jgi:hypothetical protein